MTQSKTATTVRKIAAFAIALAGIALISTAVTYFREQAYYRVPRMLVPIYEWSGNVGLAVCFAILGVALVVCGFFLWKSVRGKIGVYCIVVLVGLAIGIVTARIIQKRGEIEAMERLEQMKLDENMSLEAQMDEKLFNMERPDFSDPEIDAFFDEYDELYEKFKAAAENDDQMAIGACEQEFMKWGMNATSLIQKLEGDERDAFGLYYTKVVMDWSDLRETL